MFFRQASSCLGLTICDHEIQFLKLTDGEIRALGSYPLMDGVVRKGTVSDRVALVKALITIVKQTKSSDCSLGLALPHPLFIVKTINMPMRYLKRLSKQTLMQLIRYQTGFMPESWCISWSVRGQQIEVIGLPKKQLEDYQGIAWESHLSLQVIQRDLYVLLKSLYHFMPNLPFCFILFCENQNHVSALFVQNFLLLQWKKFIVSSDGDLSMCLQFIKNCEEINEKKLFSSSSISLIVASRNEILTKKFKENKIVVDHSILNLLSTAGLFIRKNEHVRN